MGYYLVVSHVGWNGDEQIITVPYLPHSLLLRMVETPDHTHALQLHCHASMLTSPPVMKLAVEIACSFHKEGCLILTSALPPVCGPEAFNNDDPPATEHIT